MTQYEYKVEHHDYFDGKTSLETWLDSQGSEGWQLVSSDKQMDSATGTLTFIFMRAV